MIHIGTNNDIHRLGSGTWQIWGLVQGPDWATIRLNVLDGPPMPSLKFAKRFSLLVNYIKIGFFYRAAFRL
jgi:hypothetical protein